MHLKISIANDVGRALIGALVGIWNCGQRNQKSLKSTKTTLHTKTIAGHVCGIFTVHCMYGHTCRGKNRVVCCTVLAEKEREIVCVCEIGIKSQPETVYYKTEFLVYTFSERVWWLGGGSHGCLKSLGCSFSALSLCGG